MRGSAQSVIFARGDRGHRERGDGPGRRLHVPGAARTGVVLAILLVGRDPRLVLAADPLLHGPGEIWTSRIRFRFRSRDPIDGIGPIAAADRDAWGSFDDGCSGDPTDGIGPIAAGDREEEGSFDGGLAPFLLDVPTGPTSLDPPSMPPDDLCDRPTGLKRFVCDSRALGRRLLLREPGDAARAAGVFGTAAVLFAARNGIRDDVLDHASPSRTSLYRGARTLGKGAVTPLIAAALFFGGKLSRDSYHVESAQILAESTLHAGLLAVTGQYLLASERPEDGRAVHFFRRGGHGVSGDVAIAASVVAPLDRRYLRMRPEDGPGRKLLEVSGRTALYAALALTALQRMDADKHWAPDVFLGAAAGLTAGYSICSAHEPLPLTGHRPARPALVPAAGGLALAWSF